MSEKPQYPPLRSPMVVDGQLTDPWARYFQHVVTPYFERLLNLEDMETLDWSNNRQKDHQRRIEDIERLIHEVWKTDDKGFTKRLEDLENALQFVDGPKDATLLKRFDDLELLSLISVTSQEPFVFPSVTDYEWIPSNAFEAGSSPATIVSGNDNNYHVASFADGVTQQIQFNLFVPVGMNRALPSDICILWSSPTISQDADWTVKYHIVGPDDSTDQAGTSNQSYIPSSAVSDGLMLSSLVTLAGSAIGGTDILIQCIVERDGGDVNDDLADIAEVHGAVFKYVKNKFG